MNARAAALTLTAAFAITGCADPYADTTMQTPSPPPSGTDSDTTPTTVVVPTGAPASHSARNVIAAYAVAHTNWSWRTARQQLARRQSLAGGALARDLARSRRQDATSRSWAEQRMTNRGRLVAIDARRDGSSLRAFVVLAERAGSDRSEETADRHVVYRALARRSGKRWRVTSFTQLP